jgi:hypothetical protein
MKLTRALLIGSLGLLISCAPNEAPEAKLPNYAGKFAKYTFLATVTSVRDAMFTAIGYNTGGFALTGKSKDGSVLSTFWVEVAGQPVQVYFRFVSIPNTTTVQVLTDPSPPPNQNALAISLVQLGDETQNLLKLNTYKIEADK